MEIDIDRPVTEIPPEILPKLREKYKELSKTLEIVDESELTDCTLVYVPTDSIQDLTFRRRRKR